MKVIKPILKIMGAVILTSVTTNTIVACSYDSTKVPNLNYRYGTLLGWYNEKNAASLIEQKIKYDNTADNEKYSITADKSLINVPNLFKKKLLILGSTTKTFKAKNERAAAFLQELGYISGNENQDYSPYDLKNINALIAIVKSTNPGKIVDNKNNDFQIGEGTCQIDIMSKNEDFDKFITSYTVNTTKNEQLGISNITITDIIFNKTNLKLTTIEGFKQAAPTNNFKLNFKNDDKQKQFDALVQLLNTTISIEFFTNINNWTSRIETFSNTKVFLEIHFDNIKIHRIDCGIPPTE